MCTLTSQICLYGSELIALVLYKALLRQSNTNLWNMSRVINIHTLLKYLGQQDCTCETNLNTLQCVVTEIKGTSAISSASMYFLYSPVTQSTEIIRL